MAYKNKSDQAANAKKHYERNREAMIARAAANREKTRERNREFIRKAKDVPCADCGVKYPYYVMDFDHLSDKEWNIAKMVGQCAPLERIQKEVDKCDVVCSNCHRERTHSRIVV